MKVEWLDDHSTADESDAIAPRRKHIINLRWVDKIEPWFNGGLMVKLKSLDKSGQPESMEVSRRQAARF